MATRICLALLLAVATIVHGAPPPTQASHPIPTATVVQSGLTVPWDLDFAPDGRMFVTERPGRILVYASPAPGAVLLSRTVVPHVRAEHESGANGVAIDRDFATHPYLYVCASRDADGAAGPAAWVNEVLKYRVNGNGTLTTPAVILTGAAANRQHNGCSVEMDATGYLWIGIGDAADLTLPQNPNSLNGKILRITRDGAVPGDNPILPGATGRSAAYSMGHRNPQGIAFAPDTGLPYAVEHGPAVHDEMNLIVAGGNYGWPCYTGPGAAFQPSYCGGKPASEYRNPAWSSGGVTIATSGMTFLDHSSWGAWSGTPVVAQLKEQDLRRFVTADGGVSMQQADLFLDGQFGRLRAAQQGPDGALYVTTSNGADDRIIRVAPGAAKVDRLSGSNRYATAAQISAQTFGAGVPTVYVATGLDYPDALSGGAAAARDRGPVLLVTTNGVPAATATELVRLKPQRIVVLGGTGAVSQAVQQTLARYAPGGATRISGADRFATAAAVSRSTFAPQVPVAYVATGFDYPDALAGVPAAGKEGGPILLATRSGIPSATRTELARLKPQRIVVLGGTGVVSADVARQLQEYTFSGVQRRAGSDRYTTAVTISQNTFAPGVRHVYVATGVDYPDGLTGGPAGALRGGPLLLVPGSSIPAAVRQELLRLDPEHVSILGGTGVVSDAVRAQIEALLAP